MVLPLVYRIFTRSDPRLTSLVGGAYDMTPVGKLMRSDLVSYKPRPNGCDCSEHRVASWSCSSQFKREAAFAFWVVCFFAGAEAALVRMDQFLQSPVAAARMWWYNNVWTENPDIQEDEDEMEDQLKHASDDHYSENHVVVLKVGIHCEECKRIVTDALWGMHGVDRVDVDKEKQKVTVTGKVNAQRVLRKVQRTGKLVELWKSDSARASDSCDAGHVITGGFSTEEEEEVANCTIM